MRCIQTRSMLASTAFLPTHDGDHCVLGILNRLDGVCRILLGVQNKQGLKMVANLFSVPSLSRGIHEMCIFRKEREQFFRVVLFESTEKLLQPGQRRIAWLRLHTRGLRPAAEYRCLL